MCLSLLPIAEVGLEAACTCLDVPRLGLRDLSYDFSTGNLTSYWDKADETTRLDMYLIIWGLK